MIDSNTISSFYNKVSELYVENKCSSKFYVPEVIENFLKSIPDGYEVGDFGCGPGEEVKDHGHRIKFTGFDIANDFLQLYKENVPNSKIVKSSISDLPVENEIFDAGVCLFSLLHLSMRDGKKALKEMYSKLKPNTEMLICIPSGKNEIRKGIHPEFRDVVGLEPIEFFLWDAESFKESLLDVDFEIEAFIEEPILPGRGNYIRTVVKK